MPTTPNMGITEPTVSVTAGPAWATQLNAALDTIDAHDHSPGKGARVTSAGLNVNADLGFGGNRATNVAGVQFTQVLTNGNAVIYAGSDGNLYFRDGAANLIQLTVNGGINLAATAITTDLNLNGFKLTNFAALVGVNNGSNIATALALYVQNVSTIARLRWNDNAGNTLNVANDYAVDPPVVTGISGNTALAFSANPQIARVFTSLGAYTVTLPPPANQKKPITVVDTDGNGSTNNITIARNASESICGVAANLVRRADFSTITLWSDGTNWHAVY